MRARGEEPESPDPNPSNLRWYQIIKVMMNSGGLTVNTPPADRACAPVYLMTVLQPDGDVVTFYNPSFDFVPGQTPAKLLSEHCEEFRVARRKFAWLQRLSFFQHRRLFGYATTGFIVIGGGDLLLVGYGLVWPALISATAAATPLAMRYFIRQTIRWGTKHFRPRLTG